MTQGRIKKAGDYSMAFLDGPAVGKSLYARQYAQRLIDEGVFAKEDVCFVDCASVSTHLYGEVEKSLTSIQKGLLVIDEFEKVMTSPTDADCCPAMRSLEWLATAKEKDVAVIVICDREDFLDKMCMIPTAVKDNISKIPSTTVQGWIEREEARRKRALFNPADIYKGLVAPLKTVTVRPKTTTRAIP